MAIIQRNSRFYVVHYDGLDPVTGKERRRWHPAGGERYEAEQIAMRIETDAAGSAPRRGGPVHLGEFLVDTWLPIKRRHLRASTIHRYSWMVDRYINPSIGHVPLRRLRADHVDGLYERLSITGGRHGTGLAPKTVHEVHLVVRSSLDLAVRRELVANNVAHATNARHKRPNRKVPRAWSADELAEFLASARPRRLYPALHLTAFTGIRCGEVAGLKWSDLDASRRRLSIGRNLQTVAGRPVEVPVKTRTSRRCIDLDCGTIEVLDQWRHRLLRDGLPTTADDWMFLNHAGRFVNPESLSQLFHRVQRSMPDQARIRFHDLRHTHASLMIMDGINVKVVSQRLGHANEAFTIHTYCVAADFARQGPRSFRPHLRWLLAFFEETIIDVVSRRAKRFLTAEQKYDLWIRMLSGQITQGAAAAEAGVDRTVITRIRTVARDGAIAALQASKPGKPKGSRAETARTVELEVEVARLQKTVVEQAVELAVLRGNRVGDDRSGPRPRDRDRQGAAPRADRRGDRRRLAGDPGVQRVGARPSPSVALAATPCRRRSVG